MAKSVSKAAKPVRMLTCQATGVQFPYSGRGRPALYCPVEKKRRVAARAKVVAEANVQKRKAARAAKTHGARQAA